MRGHVRAFKSGDMSPQSKAPSLKQSFFHRKEVRQPQMTRIGKEFPVNQPIRDIRAIRGFCSNSCLFVLIRG